MYKPGNVKLHPELLGKHQAFVKEKLNGKDDKPVFFVFHGKKRCVGIAGKQTLADAKVGGSGSSKQEFQTAISFGVVKVNLDTDLQWAYLTGHRDYILKKAGRSHSYEITVLN